MLVKDNHLLLHRKLEAFFAGSCLFEANIKQASTLEKGHGRLEARSIALSRDVPAGYTGFAGVEQVFCLQRTRTKKRAGKSSTETVYGITSLPETKASPRRLAGIIRAHWHIENKSHWVRDVTFDEDRSQVRKGSIPQVMAAIRNVCIGLMRVAGHKNIASACRFYAAQPQAALDMLGL